MKEFNERVKEILLRSEERNSNPRREYLIRKESGNVKYSLREIKKTVGPSLSYERCEICDWSYKTPSMFREYLNNDKPLWISYDRVSDRHLCNVCRGEGTQLSRKKIIETLEEQIDNPSIVVDDTNKRMERNFSYSYIDTIGDEVVEVKVYRPTHPKLRKQGS